MAPIRWADIFKYLRDTIREDLDNIRWVLPMACIIGFYIWMVFAAVDVIMANRERESGRYHGLDAISYVEANHD